MQCNNKGVKLVFYIGLSKISRTQINNYMQDSQFPSERLIESRILIHPNNLVLYSRIHWTGERPFKKFSVLINLEDNFHHKKISEPAKRKIKKAISYLIYTAHEKKVFNNNTKSYFTFKVNFVTLTLSSTQIHSDNEIKKGMLNQFLIEANKKWNVQNYIWKAEKQKNGNIHFHILTDKFIPWNELRNVWNRIQNKMGYVDRFIEKNGRKIPNTTDIHSLQKISNIYDYVTKYMCKNDQSNRLKVSRSSLGLPNKPQWKVRSVSLDALKFLRKQADIGRLWGCNYSLSHIEGAQAELNDKILKEIDQLQKITSTKRIDKDVYSLILFDNKEMMNGKYPILRKIFTEYIFERFGAFQQEFIYNEYYPPGYSTSFDSVAI